MPRTRRILLATLAVSIAVFSSTGLAQESARGLKSLDDNLLLEELAKRNLSTMLERAFVSTGAPDDVQKGMRASVALRALKANVSKMKPAERQATVKKVAEGIALILPRLKDSEQIASYADLLKAAGIVEDTRIIEVFGASDATRAQLKPVVQTVLKLLERCGEVATAEVDKLSVNVSPNDAKKLKQIESVQNLVDGSAFHQRLLAYQLALTLDPADPERKVVVNDAVKFLADYATEENPGLNELRVHMGKMLALRGDDEGYAKSRELLDAVIQSEGKLQPPEGADAKTWADDQKFQVAEAYYFRAVTELYARDGAGAEKAFKAYADWRAKNPLPPEQATADELVRQMLQYRVLTLQADTSAGAQQAAFRKQASDLLIGMVNANPALEGLFAQQLMAKRDPAAPVKGEDPVLLRAMISEGEAEAYRKRSTEGYAVDAKVVQRALDSADEVIARKDKDKLDARTVANAMFLRGYFLEDLGTFESKTRAVQAYLDFAAAYKESDAKRASDALDNAQGLIGELRTENRTDPGVVAAYERFLPLAIEPPFNRSQFTFLWAYHLQFTLQKPVEAIAFYQRLPANDPNRDAAIYFTLVAKSAQLDQVKQGDPQANVLAADIVKLSDAVGRAAQNSSLSGDDKASWRYRAVNATLIRADAQANHLKDNKGAIATLQSFEQLVEGVPGGDDLLGEALFIRVQSLMATGQNDAATQQLVTLLERTGGGRGLRLVNSMLDRLGRDFTDAEVAGDRARMASLQDNRATLTGYLLQWFEKSADPQMKQYVYGMRVQEAETQRLAADLDPDASRRTQRMEQVRQRFEQLDNAKGTRPWASNPQQLQPGESQYDPFVRLSLARIDFELGKWKEARDGFNFLIRNQALGGPFVTVNSAGQDPQQRDNDVYWEAHYKLFRSRLSMNDPAENTKLDLRGLYIRFGDNTGGRKWKDQLAALQKEIDPEWTPPSATTLPASTQP
jgi:hypothetical protein